MISFHGLPDIRFFVFSCFSAFLRSPPVAHQPRHHRARPPPYTTITHEKQTTDKTIATAPRDSIAEQLASVQSENPVWLEAYRMFRNIKSTEYVHPPYTVG